MREFARQFADMEEKLINLAPGHAALNAVVEEAARALNAGEFGRAIELLGVGTVVPIHHGTFPVLTGSPEQLRDELERRELGDVRVLSPAPGEVVE